MSDEKKGLFWCGWKPAIKWVASIALGYELLLRPFVPWVLKVAGWHHVPDPPALSDNFWRIIMAMLGVG